MASSFDVGPDSKVVQSIKASSARVVDIDDVWSFVDKAQSPIRLDPWLILGKVVLALRSLECLSGTDTCRGISMRGEGPVSE
jgi:hypothetical protein